MNIDWKWILITLIAFAACTIIPIRIYGLNERTRKLINWLILIPISLVIIFYCYPAGNEFFRNLATRH